MANLITITNSRSFATRANAIKAVEKIFPPGRHDNLRYFIHTDEKTGRFIPVFVGQEAAHEGVHFYFNVIG